MVTKYSKQKDNIGIKRIYTRKKRSKNHMVSLKKGELKSVFSELLGRKYKLGGCSLKNDSSESLDCWGLLNYYVNSVYGKSLESFVKNKELLSSYIKIYSINKSVAMGYLLDFIAESFVEVVTEYKKAGDIIIISCDNNKSVGIYGGNGNVLITSDTTGCVSIGVNNFKVKRAYRWLRQSHSLSKY